MTDIVTGLLLRKGRVLMGSRSKFRRNYAGTWSFPGGHVEPNEMLQCALRRELEEELGVIAKGYSKLMKTETTATRTTEAVSFHHYIVDDWEGTPKNLGDEHSELRWVSFHEACNLPDLAFTDYTEIFQILRKRGDLQ